MMKLSMLGALMKGDGSKFEPKMARMLAESPEIINMKQKVHSF